MRDPPPIITPAPPRVENGSKIPPKRGPKTPQKPPQKGVKNGPFWGSPGGPPGGPRGGPGGGPRGGPRGGQKMGKFGDPLGQISNHCVPTGRVIKYPRKCALFPPRGAPPGPPPGPPQKGAKNGPFLGVPRGVNLGPKYPLFRGVWPTPQNPPPQGVGAQHPVSSRFALNASMVRGGCHHLEL